MLSSRPHVITVQQTIGSQIVSDIPGNPYTPIHIPGHLEMQCVMSPEIRRDFQRAKQWEIGHNDRLAGEPCKSSNGAYIEGWYDQH